VDHRARILRYVGLVDKQAYADAKQHGREDADVHVLEGNPESGKVGHIGTLQSWVRVMRHCKTALPSETLDQLERRRQRGREWHQTGTSGIVLMPEGNGDMETIPAKKNRVNPIFRKNFYRCHWW
jgi:hypothetical protein